MTERFSRRYNHAGTDPEITIRNDAPEELRSVVVDIAGESGLNPLRLRRIICRVLRVEIDLGNWTEFPNVDGEKSRTISACVDWFRVYDIIEEAYANAPDAQRFQ